MKIVLDVNDYQFAILKSVVKFRLADLDNGMSIVDMFRPQSCCDLISDLFDQIDKYSNYFDPRFCDLQVRLNGSNNIYEMQRIRDELWERCKELENSYKLRGY